MLQECLDQNVLVYTLQCTRNRPTRAILVWQAACWPSMYSVGFRSTAHSEDQQTCSQVNPNYQQEKKTRFKEIKSACALSHMYCIKPTKHYNNVVFTKKGTPASAILPSSSLRSIRIICSWYLYYLSARFTVTGSLDSHRPGGRDDGSRSYQSSFHI